jgi:hypothetical protein
MSLRIKTLYRVSDRSLQPPEYVKQTECARLPTGQRIVACPMVSQGHGRQGFSLDSSYFGIFNRGYLFYNSNTDAVVQSVTEAYIGHV